MIQAPLKCGCVTHGEPYILRKKQWWKAIVIGAARQLPHVNSGRVNPAHPEGPFEEGIKIQINGAGAEIVAGMWTGAQPILSAVFAERKNGDLEGGYEVRGTPHLTGHLIVRPDDPDDRRYILVVGELPRYWPIGWIMGRDAKKPKWFTRRKGYADAYWVPHSELMKTWPAPLGF